MQTHRIKMINEETGQTLRSLSITLHYDIFLSHKPHKSHFYNFCRQNIHKYNFQIIQKILLILPNAFEIVRPLPIYYATTQ